MLAAPALDSCPAAPGPGEILSAWFQSAPRPRAPLAEVAVILWESAEGFDLLISDLAMPGMTGLQLARKARESLSELPVVLMTGFGDKTVADTAVTSFLRKPFKPEEIGSVVREVLNGVRTKDHAAYDGTKASPSTDETRAQAWSLGSDR